MRENKSLSAWRRGEQTIGCWLSLANSYSAESISNLGFDWVCIDLQHGIIDYTDLAQMLPAISTTDTTPIVRVPWNEPYEIMKVLDAGAYGVIVPMVNNRSEAEQAVHACRYPPLGNRSFGPIRGALYGGRGYAQEANDQLACIAMIETREGIDNVEEIVTTPGLNGIYIGPADLALAMGLDVYGDQPQEEHLEMVKYIQSVCVKHNQAIGIHTSSLDYAQKYLALGFNFVTLGSESGHMMKNASRELAAARGTTQAERESTGYQSACIMWLILIALLLALVFAPTLWVRWVMRAHSDEISGMPGTGGELAEHLLQKYDVKGVGVELTEAGDHYDPGAKMVRLSESNFKGKSLTAVAIAAHEVGHALQDHLGDKHLAARTRLAPLADRIARISSAAIWLAPVLGLLTRHPIPFSGLILIGMSGLVARMLMHLVTLPTEWDASFGKALPALQQGQYIAPGEEHTIRRILRAAALTYFAAALADVLNLFRWAALLLRR